MTDTTKIPSPIEFHAVRNADGTYRVSFVSDVHNRMGAHDAKDFGTRETVMHNCKFAATVYGAHSTVEIGEKREC